MKEYYGSTAISNSYSDTYLLSTVLLRFKGIRTYKMTSKQCQANLVLRKTSQTISKLYPRSITLEHITLDEKTGEKDPIGKFTASIEDISPE